MEKSADCTIRTPEDDPGDLVLGHHPALAGMPTRSLFNQLACDPHGEGVTGGSALTVWQVDVFTFGELSKCLPERHFACSEHGGGSGKCSGTTPWFPAYLPALRLHSVECASACVGYLTRRSTRLPKVRFRRSVVGPWILHRLQGLEFRCDAPDAIGSGRVPAPSAATPMTETPSHQRIRPPARAVPFSSRRRRRRSRHTARGSCDARLNRIQETGDRAAVP